MLGQAPERLADALPDDARLKFRASGDTIASTLCALLDDSTIRWPLLVTTADHALLDAGMIDEFCRGAEGADIAIGVVERRLLLRRLPDAQRTWLKFRGGALHRRQPVRARLARGPRRDRALARGRAGPQEGVAHHVPARAGDDARDRGPPVQPRPVLESLGDRFGLSIKAVKLSNPLAEVDVDKPEDHALAEAILAGNA